MKTEDKFKIKEKKEEEKETKTLSDFEYNDLEYLEAIETDNRNFFRVYWSILRREHNIIFTFFNWNDFNIFSIKLNKIILFHLHRYGSKCVLFFR